jgi:acyl-CoA synthetase (AMP-forming)/AMP-acid ligase II
MSVGGDVEGDASIRNTDTIGARLREAAIHREAATAVVDSIGTVLSFRALYDRASEVALSLRCHISNHGHGNFIATSCRNGVDSVIAAYAIWLAGGVMVPIDLELNPPTRVQQLVADCKAIHIIVADKSELDLVLDLMRGSNAISVSSVHVISLESAEVGCTNSSDRNSSGCDAAYVVYTSGSSGEPKGVVTTHSNIIEYAKCRVEVEGICSASVVLMANHFSFDIWQGDLISALVGGAAVAVSTRALIQADLTSIIVNSEVTHCCMTPSLWSLSSPSPSEVPTLRVLSLGGEKMSQRVIDVWAERVSLYNCYGATETTVFQSYALMNKGDSPNKIGVPYAFANVWLSAKGEVSISGQCVSPIGYLHDAALTADKFINLESHGLTYQTGDFGRYDDCDNGGSGRDGGSGCCGGFLYLSGRDDDLIKIRGHRIELGEVCFHVRACCAIEDAMCTYDTQSKRLVAYLKLHKYTTDTPELKRNLDDLIVVVKATVAARAPMHYVPTVFIPVTNEKWPLTVSGKTNKSALVTLFSTHQWCSTYIPPKAGVESVVASAFECALGLSANTVGRNDSFDALGGSSLNVLAVCRILEKSIEIDVSSSKKEAEVQTTAQQQQQQQQPVMIGLQEGEASSLLMTDDSGEGVACSFGVVTGVFAPCELMKRPTVLDYASFLCTQGVQYMYMGAVVGDAGCPDNNCVDGNKKAARDVDVDHIDSVIRTLITACGRGDVALVQAILNIVSSLSISNCDPLHIAAASLEPTAIDVVKCLLEAGVVDVNRANARGTSVTHIAAARGHSAMLEVLLRHGATPGVKDSDRCTILHYAVRSGDVDTVHIAAAAVCMLKTRKGGLEQWDRWKRTAASWAVHLGFVDLLQMLAVYGANLNGIEESLRQTSTQHVPGQWSERTAMQRSLRPERKKDAPVAVLTALISTMRESIEGKVDMQTGSQATSALRELVCANSENRNNARELGVIPILVKLVEEFSDVHAVGALRNMPYRNPTNAAACGDAGAVEVLAVALTSKSYFSTKNNDIQVKTVGNEGDTNAVRLQYACAAALYGLQHKCDANKKRIAAIEGLEDAISDLFKANEDAVE